jgi:hypothetical protein
VAIAHHNLALRLEDNSYQHLSAEWFERAERLAKQEKLPRAVVELLSRNLIDDSDTVNESCMSNQELEEDSGD